MEEIITKIFFTIVCIGVFIAVNFFAMNHPISSRQRKVYNFMTVVVLIVSLVTTIVVACLPFESLALLHSHIRLTFMGIAFIYTWILFVVGVLINLLCAGMTDRSMAVHVGNKVRHMSVPEFGKFIYKSMLYLSAVILVSAVILGLEIVVTYEA